MIEPTNSSIVFLYFYNYTSAIQNSRKKKKKNFSVLFYLVCTSRGQLRISLRWIGRSIPIDWLNSLLGQLKTSVISGVVHCGHFVNKGGQGSIDADVRCKKIKIFRNFDMSALMGGLKTVRTRGRGKFCVILFERLSLNSYKHFILSLINLHFLIICAILLSNRLTIKWNRITAVFFMYFRSAL